MAITANATTLTFNNGSTQTVAPVNTNANVNSVSAGTGISVSATTGALTVTNAGVTSVAAGSGISVSASTGGVTISTSGGGGVTSLNGQTGAITSTSVNTIGVYFAGYPLGAEVITTYGSTTAGSNLRFRDSGISRSPFGVYSTANGFANPGLSGTWRAVGGNSGNGPSNCDGEYQLYPNLYVRVS
jgi:hypothetical protein